EIDQTLTRLAREDCGRLASGFDLWPGSNGDLAFRNLHRIIPGHDLRLPRIIHWICSWSNYRAHNCCVDLIRGSKSIPQEEGWNRYSNVIQRNTSRVNEALIQLLFENRLDISKIGLAKP